MTIDELLESVGAHRRNIVARIDALVNELDESRRLLREVDRHLGRLVRDKELGIHQPTLPLGEESGNGPIEE